MIPAKLKVGGLELHIEQVSGLAANRDRFGEFSAMEQRVSIDISLPQGKKEETLMHEIIEALNSYYELELEHDKITTLGFALYQVLKDNKLHF
jgi:hypothetical protein